MDAADAGTYVSGMYAPEQSGSGAFRWTTPQAQLRMPGAAFNAGMFAFTAYGELDPASAHTITLRRNDRGMAVLPLEPGWRAYHVLLPRAGREAWDDPPLLLESAPLPRTADDGRDKGFPFAGFELLPIARTYVPWALLPSLGLLGLAALALLRLEHVLALPAAWRGARSALLIGVLAVPLLAWAYRDPYSYAFYLPPLPWSIGTAALLMLITRPIVARPGMALPAIALLLGGTTLLLWPAMLAAGGGLIVIGLLLFPWPAAEQAATADQQLSGRSAGLALALIFVLALGLRVYRIDELPYGLWRDEARHGLEALRMLREPAYRPAYIAEVDLPGLGLLPFSWALGIWGIQPWALRSVTALAGALIVLPLYGLVALLSGSRATALLAALLLAASHWSIALSRFSFPTIFDPLLQLTALWLLLRALGSERRLVVRTLMLLLSGACLGLAAHTYHTGRIGLLVALLFAASYWAGNRERRRAWPLLLGALGTGFVLAAYPLLAYAMQNPERFSSRLGAVSLLATQAGDWHSALGKLDRSLGAHIMMWWARGDPNGRHVAPGRPMLDPLTGLGLLVGLGLLLRGLSDWPKRCLLLGLGLGLLPSVLAVEYPHAMRSIDALGFACAIAALGFVALGRRLAIHRPDLRALPWLAVCAGVLVFNSWVYFVAMPPDRAVWTAVYPYHTQVGGYLRQLADQRGNAALNDLYVPAGLLDNAVFEYLAHDLAPRTYQPDRTTQAATGARFVVLGTLSQRDAARVLELQRLDPASGVPGPWLPGSSRPAFTVYTRN